jgi:hypothetical protein
VIIKLKNNPIKAKKKFISKAVIKLSELNLEVTIFYIDYAKLLHHIKKYPKASTQRVSQPAMIAPIISSDDDFINYSLGLFPYTIKSTIIVARTLHLRNVKNIGILTNFTENNPKST